MGEGTERLTGWEASQVVLEASVISAAEGLDSPPAGDEGFVTAVDLEPCRSTLLDRDRQRCQSCGDPVQLNEPHAKAAVYAKTGTWHDETTKHRRERLVFCDREC